LKSGGGVYLSTRKEINGAASGTERVDARTTNVDDGKTPTPTTTAAETNNFIVYYS
jgi:hypothetical protein